MHFLIMSSTQTALLIVAMVVALAATAFIVQTLESQRQQKRARMQALRREIRHSQTLLEALQGPFMSEELHRFIYQHQLYHWQQLSTLDTRAHQGLVSCQQAASQPPAPFHYPEGSLTLLADRAATLRAYSAVQQLYQWLKSLSTGANSREIRSFVKHAKACHRQARIEGMLFDAIECEQARGAEVALPHYRSCLSALEKLDYREQLDRQIYELRRYIDQLETASTPAAVTTPAKTVLTHSKET